MKSLIIALSIFISVVSASAQFLSPTGQVSTITLTTNVPVMLLTNLPAGQVPSLITVQNLGTLGLWWSHGGTNSGTASNANYATKYYLPAGTSIFLTGKQLTTLQIWSWLYDAYGANIVHAARIPEKN